MQNGDGEAAAARMNSTSGDLKWMRNKPGSITKKRRKKRNEGSVPAGM